MAPTIVEEYCNNLASMAAMQQQSYYPFTRFIQQAPEVSTEKSINKPKEGKVIESVKGYINKHRDFLMTLVLVLVVDHIVFKGALREKIKTVVDGALQKANNQHQKEA